MPDIAKDYKFEKIDVVDKGSDTFSNKATKYVNFTRKTACIGKSG